MIYIAKNQLSHLISDSLIDYLPTQFSVYLDDILVGSYANISDSIFYHIIEIPSEDISQFANREYKLKWVDNGATIKTELCLVKDFTIAEIKSVTKTKTIKTYE